MPRNLPRTPPIVPQLSCVLWRSYCICQTSSTGREWKGGRKGKGSLPRKRRRGEGGRRPPPPPPLLPAAGLASLLVRLSLADWRASDSIHLQTYRELRVLSTEGSVSSCDRDCCRLIEFFKTEYSGIVPRRRRQLQPWSSFWSAAECTRGGGGGESTRAALFSLEADRRLGPRGGGERERRGKIE